MKSEPQAYLVLTFHQRQLAIGIYRREDLLELHRLDVCALPLMWSGETFEQGREEIMGRIVRFLRSDGPAARAVDKLTGFLRRLRESLAEVVQSSGLAVRPVVLDVKEYMDAFGALQPPMGRLEKNPGIPWNWGPAGFCPNTVGPSCSLWPAVGYCLGGCGWWGWGGCGGYSGWVPGFGSSLFRNPKETTFPTPVVGAVFSTPIVGEEVDEVVLDVSSEGNGPDGLKIPISELPTRLHDLAQATRGDFDRRISVCGNEARLAKAFLRELGFRRVHVQDTPVHYIDVEVVRPEVIRR